MSMLLATLTEKSGKKLTKRSSILALRPPIEYNDGRTIQSHKDETDINKIMARFAVTGTISHIEKNQGFYADFSDFDFHQQQNRLSRGRAIFDELDAEIRREFHQSPDEFFQYVNDPKNLANLREKLPGLAAPGRQLDAITPASADLDAAKAIVKAAEDAAKPAEPSAKPADPSA